MECPLKAKPVWETVDKARLLRITFCETKS
jgi:hypothetical protein